MGFLDLMEKQASYKLTENGQLAYNTTRNPLLDLFAQAGAIRNRNEEEVSNMFVRALVENKELATKMAFYSRDVREALGERKVGRNMFVTLANEYPDIMKQNVKYIGEYGRWDDLLPLLDTPVKDEAINVIKDQLRIDIEAAAKGEECSLLGKWLPSINASKSSRKQALIIKDALGMSSAEYRHMLTDLRTYLHVVEQKVSKKDFSAIDYSTVPSYAMKKYSKLFAKEDPERFNEYLKLVEEGKKKINASVLYPYDIVEKLLYHSHDENEALLNEQWKALPDFVKGDNKFLVMADVSGSMYGRPMATSIGLALYFAERNEGEFHNKFLTFSESPQIQTIKGNTISEKVKYLSRAPWGMNTDLEKAFDLILDTAVKNNVAPEELPTSLVVISDMEIDAAVNNNSLPGEDFTAEMKARFEEAGYTLPNLVYWNVDARHQTFHAQELEENVQFLSGSSPSQFKALCERLSSYPDKFMVEVLSSERYACITVPEKYKEEYLCKSDERANRQLIECYARFADDLPILSQEARKELQNIILKDSYLNSEIKAFNDKVDEAAKNLVYQDAPKFAKEKMRELDPVLGEININKDRRDLK